MQSVRTIKVTNGTLTDDGDGVVTLDTGGVETLEALTDVTITNAANGQVIKYLNGIWINAADGGAISLNDLTDVIISQPAQGEFFRYDGGEWVNDTASKSDVGLGNVDNTSDANKPISTATQTALDLKADITSVPTELDDLNDVQIIGTPTLGQALVYGAGKWLPGAAGATDLGDLDDVNTTGAAFGSLLTYNGASWDISGSQLPTDDIYFHQRYETESEALRTGATATTELYFTCTAQGNGLAESASSDTPTAGKIIRRKIYYSEEGFADPDTGTWVEFTPAPADDASFATVKAALLEYLKARTGGTVPISLKQTWEEVAAAPTFTGLLNETYGSGAAAAYGTRRLNGNYSGACMTIRRASDGTTQTIGFVGEEIDESAITTFCTGTTCTVQVWHDQSQTGGTGSGNDAEQTTPANQPTIYTGGQLVKEGGRLALDFQGDSLNQSSFLNSGDDLTFVFVSTDLLGDTATPKYFIYTDTGNVNGSIILRANSGNTATSVNFGYSLTNYVDGTVAQWTNRDVAYDLFKSGQRLSFNYGSVNTTQSGSNILIGNRTENSTQSIRGKLQEMLFWTADKSSVRTDIEGNISAYYQSAKLLDESYGSGAEAAYSVRQLKRDNTECMVIRRASDSTTQTIGFDGSGNISEADIISFCTGTTCTLYQWLDQSGNGNTATQTDSTKQPIIYTGGELLKEKGVVAMSMDYHFLMTSVINTSTFSIFAVVRSLGDSYLMNKDGGNVQVRINIDNANYLSVYPSPKSSDAGTTYTQQLAAYIGNSSTLRFFQNSTSIGTAGNHTINQDVIGGFSNGTQPTTMLYQELVVYNSDQYTAGNQTSIESNIGDYFTQNTPLLDTYSGAAAAYSLRLLDSSYVGSAIRVRRSSDNTEQDIGFNVFGELDTVSLLAFAGTGDAFVKVWYDQASTNDATQTTTANQPKIVSSGAVIVENGKPAVENVLSGKQGLNIPSFTINLSDFTCTLVSKFYADSSTEGRPIMINGDTQATYDYRYKQFSITRDRFYLGTSTVQSYSNNVSYTSNNNLQLHTITPTNGYVDGTSAGTFGTAGEDLDLNPAFNYLTSGDIGRDRGTHANTSEVIIWTADQTGNRAGIETNINTFYSIY